MSYLFALKQNKIRDAFSDIESFLNRDLLMKCKLFRYYFWGKIFLKTPVVKQSFGDNFTFYLNSLLGNNRIFLFACDGPKDEFSISIRKFSYRNSRGKRPTT